MADKKPRRRWFALFRYDENAGEEHAGKIFGFFSLEKPDRERIEYYEGTNAKFIKLIRIRIRPEMRRILALLLAAEEELRTDLISLIISDSVVSALNAGAEPRPRKPEKK